ncbi:putative E3 ubiquitin-protein ligase RHA4A [Silene latifolia]|uniref:putative E3 ubiquitin-protein ligase RHA4A n=1 Tax=Silene latifolia TaxID=37657 RepID=UPI003D7800FC
MGKHEGEARITNPSLYPEQLQIKLYQAFIFSIPILFSIILFLLFYLFYLKRRAANNNVASQNPRIQLSAISSTRHHSAWNNNNVGIKGELKEKLQVIRFDDKVKARDSLCCVCLGEFEMEEELRQVRLCRHVFHGDCIYQWLRANATCPLCRCPLLSPPPPPLNTLHLIRANTTIHQVLQNHQAAQQQDQGERTQSSSVGSVEHVIQISEEPSSSNTSSCLSSVYVSNVDM